MTTNRRGPFRRGRHDGGASAVEYALILAGVALVAVAAIYLLGQGVKGAFIAAEGSVSSTVQPSGVPSSALPTTTSPAPTTTSPAPTTTSPAPTTTSPAPTTTSPAPTTTSPAPTPTTTNPPRTDTINGTGSETILDLDLPNNANLRNTAATMTPDYGSISWNGDRLVLNPDNDLRDNRTFTTVVTYTYTLNGTVYVGTITVTIRT
jgi:Flp pilus assembly pilin Flp